MKFFLLYICLFSALHTFGLTSKEATSKLLEGNLRFVANQSGACISDQEVRRRSLVDNQKPFAIILGCSDSRVPPEILFDQGIGSLFIIRVAGNVLGPSEIDSITYAVKVLECPLIVVLGHQNCGAVKAVMDGKADLIPYIKSEILASFNKDDKSCDLICHVKKNVEHIVSLIKKTSGFAKEFNDEKLKVIGAYYPFVSGKVEFME